MENCENVKTYKRLRDDSESDSESKRLRHDSHEDELNSSDSKLPESEISVDVSKIRDEILDILDEPEDGTEIQDLDSVIKSFEEEIVHSTPAPDPGELGYLLEASDDELGLPPANSPTDDKPKEKEKFDDLADNPSYAFAFEENAEFENAIPSYDSFGFGFGEDIGGNNDGDNGDFVTVGGLFDYPEASDFNWQPETLPAQ